MSDNISNESKDNTSSNIEDSGSGFINLIDLSSLKEGIGALKKEVSSVIVGQEKLIKLMIAAILSDGHVLLEGFPGLAKTLAAKLMAKTIDTDFSRIQFTPDLMPSDVLGTSVYDFKEGNFDFKKGPIFSNFILIDEINRAPAKTQAALFEVMEEKQVTIDGNKMKMEDPFIIIATQNPIDMEGTYSLPEAQLDRFIFKIKVDYPSLEQEVEILSLHQDKGYKKDLSNIKKVLSSANISEYKALVKLVRVDVLVMKYIANIVHSTRNHKDVFLGASPRASLALLHGSKAIAAMNGRDFVIPEDIHELADSVLAHRIILTAEKEMEGSSAEEVIADIIQSIEIPR